MSDYDLIWLQPECCADSDVGRLWCQDPDPEDCPDGVPWTKYIRADLAEAPDLFEALDDLLHQVRSDPPQWLDLDMAEQALNRWAKKGNDGPA